MPFIVDQPVVLSRIRLSSLTFEIQTRNIKVLLTQNNFISIWENKKIVKEMNRKVYFNVRKVEHDSLFQLAFGYGPLES